MRTGEPEVQELPVYLPGAFQGASSPLALRIVVFGLGLARNSAGPKPCTDHQTSPAHRDPIMRLTVVVSILQYQSRVVGDDGAELQQLHAGVLAGAGKIDHVFGLDAPGELAFHQDDAGRRGKGLRRCCW